MGGLLHHARKFFRGITPAPLARPQSFAVACSEGHRLTGRRTEGYQALRCPTCGEGLFVLPRSPLPEPSAPSASAAPAATLPEHREGPASPWADEPHPLTDPVPDEAAEPEADAEIEWVDEAPEASSAPGPSPEDLAEAEIAAQAEAPPPPRPRAARPAAAKPGKAGEKSRPKPPPRKPEPEPEPARPRVSLGERLRRNQAALIFAGVVLVVVATVALRTWRARRAALPGIAERGRSEGLPALDAGQFDKANQILAEARHAVEALGGEYKWTEQIIQGAKEAAIIAGRCPRTLEEMLAEAANSDPKEWPKRFETYYKGRSFVFDARIAHAPDPQGDGDYDLDYRVFPEGEGEPQSVGRIDLAGFQLFHRNLKPAEGDRIRFGARVASFRFDANAGLTGTWLIGLEPDSGVIMTHQKALEIIGLVPDEPGGEDRP